jgi:hypothetical protein
MNVLSPLLPLVPQAIRADGSTRLCSVPARPTVRISPPSAHMPPVLSCKRGDTGGAENVESQT